MTQRISFFGNWPRDILKPVLVNVFTAIILFFLAIAFKPLVIGFFSVPKIAEYPVICRAEPYLGVDQNEIRVDFFIINRFDAALSREQLATDLKLQNPDADLAFSPDILLQTTQEGRIRVEIDTVFNKGKGELRVVHTPESQQIKIIIGKIEPRAILKVIISASHLNYVSPHINRGVRGEAVRIIRNYEILQDRGYSTL